MASRRGTRGESADVELPSYLAPGFTSATWPAALDDRIAKDRGLLAQIDVHSTEGATRRAATGMGEALA